MRQIDSIPSVATTAAAVTRPQSGTGPRTKKRASNSSPPKPRLHSSPSSRSSVVTQSMERPSHLGRNLLLPPSPQSTTASFGPPTAFNQHPRRNTFATSNSSLEPQTATAAIGKVFAGDLKPTQALAQLIQSRQSTYHSATRERKGNRRPNKVLGKPTSTSKPRHRMKTTTKARVVKLHRSSPRKDTDRAPGILSVADLQSLLMGDTAGAKKTLQSRNKKHKRIKLKLHRHTSNQFGRKRLLR